MEKIQNLRGVLLLEGVLFVILGLAAIALPGLFTLGIELFIGWLFLIGGIVLAYRSFQSRQSSSFLTSLLTSIFYIIFGGLLVWYPLTGIVSLTIMLAVFFLIDGIAKIALSLGARNLQGWAWILFSGLLSLGMSAIIFAGLPGTAIWVLGLLVGINILFFGISLLTISNKIPKQTKA